MISVTTLTITLVVIYLAVIKAVSFYAHRASANTIDDYFLTGRNTGTLVLMGTMLATGINALAFTAVPALVFEGGILISQMIFLVAISGFIQWYYGPKVWTAARDNRFITQAELFGHRYQSKFIYGLTALIAIASVFPFLLIQFIAVAKIFSLAVGNAVTYHQTIILLALITGLYIFWGGSKAVVWTDVIQGFVFTVIFMLSAYLFTRWAGGFSTGIAKLYEVMPEKLVFNSDNTSILLDRMLSWSFAFVLFPQGFQRLMMGRSPEIVRKGVMSSVLIGFPTIFVSLAIIGLMATASLYGQIRDHDQLVAAMYMQHWPLGVALITVAAIACGMSTIDSILLSISSVFTRNVAEPLLAEKLSETAEYRLAKGVSIYGRKVRLDLGGSRFF
ncbi:MAG: hypothetical protein GY862_26800 [Gammaproteobacteria bacterium]|nr:hypothetical protein [Gammaproteobacteria bacterium]